MTAQGPGSRPPLLAVAVLVLVLVLVPHAALAQEDAVVEEETPLWTGEAGLSFLATGGNTETESVGLDFELTREPVPWGFELRAKFSRAEEDGRKTAERYLAGARALRSLGDRWELFGGVTGEKDEFAGIDLRMLAEVGATYDALTGPTHALSFDAGLTYTDEDRLPPSADESFLGAVLGLDYEWTISENASLGERLLVYPNFDESSDWRAESVLALTATLTERFALQAAYEIRYRNEPLSGRDDTDTATKLSFVAKL